jgi:transglutaminase-like putative cysteine protease
MAKASGWHTGGIVYMEGMGFLYHAWAESFVDDWLPVDATFNQVPVDATHIKLVEGPDWISLLPMGSVIGHIRIRNIRFHCGENGN